MLLDSRFDEISNLIQANKKSDCLNIQKMSKSSGKLNFCHGLKQKKTPANKTVKQIAPNSKSGVRIQLPFYVCPLKDHSIAFEFGEGKNGSNKFNIKSQRPPIMYQDFEVLKKIKSANKVIQFK